MTSKTTALDGIERLETTALWREDAGAQRREVYVSIGEAELVVQDTSGDALAHWSLPALVRLNPGTLPARFAPARGADEDLEIAEPEMVEALDRVMAAVEKGRRRPGALRRLLTGLIAGFAAGTLLLWLPGAMRLHAANVMSAAQRSDIGERMLSELAIRTGPPCGTLTGTEALATLRARVLPTTPARLEVLRGLPQPALALPGGLFVLSDSTLVAQDDPNVTAGHVLATASEARATAPIVHLLDGLGPVALLRLMASGEVTDAAIAAQVERDLLAPPATLPPDMLRSVFAAASLAWDPYAADTGLPPGEATPSDMRPALDDTTWQALRGICEQ